ncbi:MAG: chemotaxis-specific protein-glutamate methyltransferase CheB [Desulfobacterales bacterium]|nr:chemotaxis-specific protein-glutamate methyltransferase CheB [Desulfobacterales bacterium]
MTNRKKIRVLIVDDSATAREYLRYIISRDEELEVAGAARNGFEAVELVQIKRPDVITMDIQMPRMDGYEATRKIMELYPVPIVIISSQVIPEQVQNTFRAIKAGAVAALEKPKGPSHSESGRMAEKIVQTIKLMSEVKVIKRFPTNRETETRTRLPAHQGSIRMVAIGASTGGPPVIQAILSNLVKSIPVPILIVQHIAPGFLHGMVEWMSKETGFPIKVGVHGDRTVAGHVYFAPDGFHMGVTREGGIFLAQSSPENGLRPSVSYLFRSTSKSYGRRSAGILLTGMGRDGARELKEMKDQGSLTIAQDKESSIVHGMPGEAIKMDAADHILPPEKIAEFLNQTVIGK